MRLDVYLFSSGMAPSRRRAAELILRGAVTVKGKTVLKPSAETDGEDVLLLFDDLPYVGRGGLKLRGALDAFRVDPAGLVCLDLGASTGGFTDCLLQRGARKVYALDVGHGQLHEKLKNDARVISLEGFNARDLCETSLPEKVDLAVSDLSFISQRLIYAPLRAVLKEGRPFISLVKPQFEAGRAALNKKGVVTDPAEHLRVLCELRDAAFAEGFVLTDVCRSPIDGADGNREYTALFYLDAGEPAPEAVLRRAVYGTPIPQRKG